MSCYVCAQPAEKVRLRQRFERNWDQKERDWKPRVSVAYSIPVCVSCDDRLNCELARNSISC